MKPVNDRPRGVGGWLLLLSGLMRFGEPIHVAVILPAALTALPIRGTPLALVLLLRLAVAALGIAAGRALAGRHHGAVTLAKASLALSAVTAVFVYTTPYFPNNRMPGDTPLYIAATLAYERMGLLGLAIFAVPPLMLGLTIRQYLDRTRASVEEVRTVNEELKESNDRAHRTYLSTIAALSRSIEVPSATLTTPVELLTWKAPPALLSRL